MGICRLLIMTAGRPEAKIEWTQVETWLREGRSGPQIAATLGISPDCLYYRCRKDINLDFSSYAQEKRAMGDGELHTAQFKKAMRGDSQMLKHLGEWRLGQKEKRNDESNVEGARETVALLESFRAYAKANNDAKLEGFIGSLMAHQQSILDKGQPGEQDEVLHELGSEGVV